MEKRIVLPGEKISDNKLFIPDTYVQGDSTYAAVIGMIDEEGRYVPLENRYKPVVNDTVVGVVVDVRHAGYEVDLNLPEGGFIPTRNIRMTLQLGDYVLSKVKSVSEVGDVDLGEIRRLPKGKIVQFPSAKVPRLIGRKSSMLLLLKDYAGGDLIVGNNGYVWISEKSNMPVTLKAISLIESRAHKSGLTDAVSAMLRKECGDRPVRSETEENYEGVEGSKESYDFEEKGEN